MSVAGRVVGVDENGVDRMIVNGANLNAIFLNLSKVFNQTFNEVEVEYPAIAMVVPSNGAYVDYRWLANFSDEGMDR